MVEHLGVRGRFRLLLATRAKVQVNLFDRVWDLSTESLNVGRLHLIRLPCPQPRNNKLPKQPQLLLQLGMCTLCAAARSLRIPVQAKAPSLVSLAMSGASSATFRGCQCRSSQRYSQHRKRGKSASASCKSGEVDSRRQVALRKRSS